MDEKKFTYSITVTRDVPETCTITVEAWNRYDAADAAVELAKMDAGLDWRRDGKACHYVTDIRDPL